MGIIVDGKELDGPDGVVIKNFNDPSVFHFKNQPRQPKAVTEVVVHETVSASWESTVTTLKARGLGVHFIADADGTIYQHADLMIDEMWHASQHNGMSVGIETVNPFEPGFAPANGPWKNRLTNVPWTRPETGHVYVVPTPEQSEAVALLLYWLSSSLANPITIPQAWPGLSQANGKTTMSLTRVAKCNTPPEPGILAHTYWAHGDGAWLVLYAWLRWEANLDPQPAYEEAQKRAQGVWNADLTDYFTANPYLTI